MTAKLFRVQRSTGLTACLSVFNQEEQHQSHHGGAAANPGCKAGLKAEAYLVYQDEGDADGGHKEGRQQGDEVVAPAVPEQINGSGPEHVR